MSGRRRGGSGRGWKHSPVAALAALGCCLLSAPTAHADFDDLIDSVLGAATAGPDLADLGGVPADLGAFDVHSVLNDPLAQLDQMFHDSPGQLGLDEPTSDPADTTPGSGAAHDTTGDTGGSSGAGHNPEGGNSSTSPSLPKFSMPGGGSGGGGSGGSGGGPGGSGGPSGNNTSRTKANTGATKDTAAPAPAAQTEVP